MTPDDDDFSALCATLREEAGEQVDRIGAVLVEIEADRGGTRARALLDEAFRQAPNLKGAAGSLGFPLPARLAHALESALAGWDKGDALLVVTAGGLKPVSKLRKVFGGDRTALALAG